MSFVEGYRQRTAAANQARQQGTCRRLERIEAILRRMQRDGTRITYTAVAISAGVSRTFLYQNADASKLMTEALAAAEGTRLQAQSSRDERAEASWRQRALNAEDALKIAYAEIGTQRNRIAVLMGQIRGLQAECGNDTIQRAAAENSDLKERARGLAEDNRSLQDKLHAARSNNRFLDRRIADLEARLLDPVPVPGTEMAPASQIQRGNPPVTGS
jgi:chromosome segregation ATPase